MTVKHFNIATLSLLGLLTVAYLALSVNLVLSVVGTQRASEQLSRISPGITTLESQYLALSGSVTLERAYALGFRDAPDSSYARLARSRVY